MLLSGEHDGRGAYLGGQPTSCPFLWSPMTPYLGRPAQRRFGGPTMVVPLANSARAKVSSSCESRGAGVGGICSSSGFQGEFNAFNTLDR